MSNITSIFEGQEKKRKKGAQKKGGENSPISPPLDPRLLHNTYQCDLSCLFLNKNVENILIWYDKMFCM